MKGQAPPIAHGLLRTNIVFAMFGAHFKEMAKGEGTVRATVERLLKDMA